MTLRAENAELRTRIDELIAERDHLKAVHRMIHAREKRHMDAIRDGLDGAFRWERFEAEDGIMSLRAVPVTLESLGINYYRLGVQPEGHTTDCGIAPGDEIR